MRPRFLPHLVACAIGGACGGSDASFEFRQVPVEAIEFPPLFEPLTATARGVLGSLGFPDGVQWLAEWPA